jgi:phosphoserine phosphatase
VLPVTYGIAVGDSANDLDMISAARLGIAFNAKPAVRLAADTSPGLPDLHAIHLLGTSREDVEAAKAENPALPGDGRILRLAED